MKKNLIIYLKIVFVCLISSCISSCSKTKKKSIKYELDIVVCKEIVTKIIPQSIVSLCLPVAVGDSMTLIANKEPNSPLLLCLNDSKITQSIYVNTDTGNPISKFFGFGTKLQKNGIEKKLTETVLSEQFTKKFSTSTVMKKKLDSIITIIKEKNGFALILGENKNGHFYKDVQVLPTVDSIRIVIAQKLSENKDLRNITILYGVGDDLLNPASGIAIKEEDTKKEEISTVPVIPFTPPVVVPNPKPPVQTHRPLHRRRPVIGNRHSDKLTTEDTNLEGKGNGGFTIKKDDIKNKN